ncbi:hypothetical protein NDU88_000302 [Pleurodeles waltl]|uniref:Uncharacterized protein n=1 Tax=Pleurodeles waltl TaxID=8319 RepID=A0AAV7Q6M9_PLEWA|nr:hypothetical protein NDU88_000302 [Pleurodeles waltl]
MTTSDIHAAARVALRRASGEPGLTPACPRARCAVDRLTRGPRAPRTALLTRSPRAPRQRLRATCAA